MLLGTHTPRLDDKGRVVLPAKFRDELTTGIVLTKGQDNCVVLWPEAEFATYAQRLNEASRSNAAVRSYLRVLFSGAFDQVPDKQGRISLPLTPGSHRLLLRWRGAAGQASWLRTESLGLGVAGVNETLSVTLPRDRVVLAMGLSGAPALGPAVLFWGVLLVLLGAVALLRRQTDLPLSSRAWLLLALGLAPASLAGLAVLLGWFLLLRQRARWVALPRWQHNALQVAVLIWTLLTALALLYALRTGLLGHPDLLVQGNDSSAHALNWYLDRLSGHSHSAWVLSLPIWVYRVAMLLWALWLAHALLGWVRWAWGCFSAGGLWRSKPKRAVPPPSET